MVWCGTRSTRLQHCSRCVCSNGGGSRARCCVDDAPSGTGEGAERPPRARHSPAPLGRDWSELTRDVTVRARDWSLAVGRGLRSPQQSARGADRGRMLR